MDYENIGQQIYNLISDLYPICRSITGDGFRESLRIINKHIPLKMHEVPSGTQVFDWTVPKEWNIQDAYVMNQNGDKVIDFQHSNLHILNYSIPIHAKMPLAKLKEHLFSLSDQPDLIPYRTSYYAEKWGFCLSHNDLAKLEDGEYEVYIDSSLQAGSLTYGEYYLRGEIEDEILISCHSCHPSLANDNLSGMSVATYLAKQLSTHANRYSYRFLFIPGTIGAITWLVLNEQNTSKIKHGLVIACVGDPGNLTYKKSRRGDAEIDQVVLHVLKHSGQDYNLQDFSPFGYDERQYCSPGFNLPVGSLTRSPHGRYPEYHTSGDNLDFVQPEYLADSFEQYIAVLTILEKNKIYLNVKPQGEPQLGRRGLYGVFGGKKDANSYELALLWTLNFSDGKHSLLDIAERSGFDFEVIHAAAQALIEHDLLIEINPK